MRNSLKKSIAVVSSVALFAFFGFGYSSVVKAAQQSARVTAIVICLGAPQENVEVSLGDRAETTKKNGGCVFDIGAGSYTISAQTKSGKKSVNLDLKPGEVRQVVLELCQPEKWPQIFPYGGPSDVQK